MVKEKKTKARGRGTTPHRKRETVRQGSAFKKGSQMRTASTINRLNMYKTKMPKKEQLQKQALAPQRIAPDRRWFGNTRVITQQKMQDFRAELSKSVNDPFSVVLKSSKLPLSLLEDSKKATLMNLLSIESYQSTFGSKKQRKRPKLASYDLEDLIAKNEEKSKEYEEEKDTNLEFELNTGLPKEKVLFHS